MCGGGSEEVPETSSERALAQVAMKDWQREQEVFGPLKEEYLSTLEPTAGDETAITGQISAGIGQAYGEAKNRGETDLLKAGINPGSGRMAGEIGDMAIQQARAAGSGMARGGQAVNDTGVVNMMNAVKMGRGEAADVSRDMTTLAADASREAIGDAMAENDRKDTFGSAVMTTAGMGLAGFDTLRPKTVAVTDGRGR